jgi:hypothetical protein
LSQREFLRLFNGNERATTATHRNGLNREIALEALGAFDLSNKGGPKGGTPADKTLSMVKGFLQFYF